jgi:hypothetical protein
MSEKPYNFEVIRDPGKPLAGLKGVVQDEEGTHEPDTKWSFS